MSISHLIGPRATSSGQAEAFAAGTVPAPEWVREGILAIAVPMPERDLPFSLSYAVVDASGGIHIVDAGVDSDNNWALFTAALAASGLETTDIATVTITHLHHDHTGMAARIREASGARIGMHRLDLEAIDAGALLGGPGPIAAQLEGWGVPRERWAELEPIASRPAATGPAFEVGATLEHGDLLPADGRRLRVLHTPGHTPGHVVVRDEQEGLLFSGDHVLAVMFPGIGLGGRPDADTVGDYQRSLELVARYPDDEVLPGHGYRFTGLAERAEIMATHHRHRTSEIATIVANGPDLTVWQVASRISWTAGFPELAGLYLYSALSQVEQHLEHLRITAD